jgi:hypothetical protein
MKMKYKVYFILEGKKLKMMVSANTRTEAKEIVKNKYPKNIIEFVTCMPIYEENDNVEYLKNIFGIK